MQTNPQGAKLGWRQRGFPVWPTPCLVYAGQTDRQGDRQSSCQWQLVVVTLCKWNSHSWAAVLLLLLPKRLWGEPAPWPERESLMHAGIYIIPPSQLKTLDSRQVPRTKTLTQIRLALGARQARPRPKPNINYNHATRAQDSDNRTTSKLIEINANAQSRQKGRGGWSWQPSRVPTSFWFFNFYRQSHLSAA